MKIFYSALILLVTSCTVNKIDTATEIVERCIQVHGGTAYEEGRFEYTFRGRQYELQYEHGKYRYSRLSVDTAGHEIIDILTNSDFTRLVDSTKVPLSQKDIQKYTNSVRSVHYFAYLPFFLSDPAVRLKRLKDEVIHGFTYHKIEVTFVEQGGGVDYDDVYVYWIRADDFTMDYLAYSYEVDGGGVRFREAYDPREVGGIRWQDYVNYKHEKTTPPAQMASLFQKDELVELSRIELENITAIH
ncbi:MAG: DUF6503 family protein [Bacteroidota bacterium]